MPSTGDIPTHRISRTNERSSWDQEIPILPNFQDVFSKISTNLDLKCHLSLESFFLLIDGFYFRKIIKYPPLPATLVLKGMTLKKEVDSQLQDLILTLAGWNCWLDQADFKVRDLLASASQVMGLKTCSTMSGKF